MLAVVAAALAVALSSCSVDGAAGAGDHGEDVAQVRSAITDGLVDPGHPAVGAVHTAAGYACTGTLVGPRVVLTAAHCIAPGLTDFRFVVEGRSYAAASVTPHPRYDPTTQLADVAVVVLDAAPPIVPAPLSSDAPRVGTPITVVGLGCPEGRTRDCAYGTKRMTANTVASVSPDELVFASAPGEAGGHCDGDSGGPTFARVGQSEAVIGVHSSGPVGCRGDNVDARVDVQLAWIREQAGGDVIVASHEANATSPASSAGAAGCAAAVEPTPPSPAVAAVLVLSVVSLARVRRRPSV